MVAYNTKNDPYSPILRPDLHIITPKAYPMGVDPPQPYLPIDTDGRSRVSVNYYYYNSLLGTTTTSTATQPFTKIYCIGISTTSDVQKTASIKSVVA